MLPVFLTYPCGHSNRHQVMDQKSSFFICPRVSARFLHCFCTVSRDAMGTLTCKIRQRMQKLLGRKLRCFAQKQRKLETSKIRVFCPVGSFNQRARDSSSLERTKIPRRIVRFLVGFSFFWGSAHFCTLFAHRRESRVFPCIVCILCIVSVFSILFSGEQQAGELTPLLGVHLSDNFQQPFRGDLDAVRQIFFYRHRAGFGGTDVL